MDRKPHVGMPHYGSWGRDVCQDSRENELRDTEGQALQILHVGKLKRNGSDQAVGRVSGECSLRINRGRWEEVLCTKWSEAGVMMPGKS